MELEEVMHAVKRAAGKPETISRIRYWTRVMVRLFHKDAMTYDPDPLSKRFKAVEILNGKLRLFNRCQLNLKAAEHIT